jgi:hypothetical protein
VKELPGLNEINSQPIKRGRSKNFSVEEDLMLVSAYLNVSKDPITGRDQKKAHFGREYVIILTRTGNSSLIVIGHH